MMETLDRIPVLASRAWYCLTVAVGAFLMAWKDARREERHRAWELEEYARPELDRPLALCHGCDCEIPCDAIAVDPREYFAISGCPLPDPKAPCS